MKRIIALFLSLLIVLSCAPVAFAANAEDTTIAFNLTVDGQHTITVPTGSEILVTFSLDNVTDNEMYKVKSFDNEVGYYPADFELVPGSVEMVECYTTGESDTSWKEHRIYFGGFYETSKQFDSKNKVIVRFKLKVLATQGQYTITSNKSHVFYGDSKEYTLNKNDLTVIIGDAPQTLYNVVYMNNGTEYRKLQTAGEVSVLAAPVAPSGYRFLGWENNGILYQPGDSFDVTEDVTFTAKWEEIIYIPDYTLSFVSNGGTAVSNITKPEGTVIDLNAYNPTKTGYTFEGWYEDEQLTSKVTSVTLDGNKTVYAKWKEVVAATYTLTFNTNGGSAISSLTKEEGAVIDLSAYKPTRTGYTFDGWYKDVSLTQSVTSITLTENTIVYAKWTKSAGGGGGGGGGGAAPADKLTLTFDTDGGSKIDSVTGASGAVISLEKYVPVKEGYEFAGWYSDKGLTTKVTQVTLNGNTTVYAKWIVSGDSPVVVKPDYKPEILTDEHYAYIVGRDGGMIAPQSDITRAEVATIIYRLLDEDVRNNAKTNENVFTDVNENDWFNTAVSTLASLQLVNGRTADTFAPNSSITRAELATIFARMVEVECDDKVMFSDVSGHWAESYIKEAATAEWIVGYDGLFRPNDNITRAEVMTLVNRVMNREPESTEDLLDGMTTWKDNADEGAWYYLAIQEATNSHTCEMKADGKHEKWTALTENPDWSKLEK